MEITQIWNSLVVEPLMHLLSANSAVIYSLKPSATDPNGPFQLTFVSENLSQVLGYSPSECLSNHEWWPQSVHPEDREKLQNVHKKESITL